MNERTLSFLGSAYEGAFKLGFLQRFLSDDEYNNFKSKDIFEKLKVDYLSEELKERFGAFWDNLRELVPGRLEELQGLELRYTEKNLLALLFLTGYWQGFCFSKGFEKESPHLIKYWLGEGSSVPGAYENADLLFVAGSTLYVVEFKLAGARRKAQNILEREEEYLPIRIEGLPISLSMGEMRFERFVEHLLKVEKELLEMRVVSPEIKGFVQAVSYAADYLSNSSVSNSVSEICLCLFYPLAEAFMARFSWQQGDSLKPHIDKLRQLYKKLRDQEGEYAALREPTPIRIKRITTEAQQEIPQLQAKMEKLHRKPHLLRPRSISECRTHVQKMIDEFFQRPERVKVLALLHSAGSGKTSALRQKILSQSGKHIVIYCATRKILIDREYEQLKQRGGNVAVVYESRIHKTNRQVAHQGTHFEKKGAAQGILQRTVNRIREYTSKAPFIWALVTQQAFTQTTYGKTAEHLKDLLSPRLLDNYQFHLILDEFLGHTNGLYVINELISFLKNLKDHKGAQGRASLYLLDANGFSIQTLEKLLIEYRHFQVIPEALMLSDYQPEGSFMLEDIPVYGGSVHGYPAPEIYLYKNFMTITSSENSFSLQTQPTPAPSRKNASQMTELLAKRLTEYIQKTFPAKSDATAFVFLQDKELLAHLKRALEQCGYPCLLVTADSRQSQSRINEGKEDILLATSTLSRGIDLARPHKPISTLYMVVLNWGIERNLVELLQAISRARGDKNTESQPKHLHLLYPLYPIQDRHIQDLLNYLEEEHFDKNVLKVLLEKHVLQQKLNLDEIITEIITRFVEGSESRQVLVPIPAQFESRYIPSDIGDWESIVSFIDNVSLLENEENIRKKLHLLREKLLQAIFLYVMNVNLEGGEYYHPYVLLEGQGVRYGFDNNLRVEIKRYFEEVKDGLQRHNPEKTELLGKLIEESLPAEEFSMSVLMPVYGWVITQYFIGGEGRYGFRLSSRVGRGGAHALMGSVSPRTFCAKNATGLSEYPCIPLGEDYPYREVLGGRFAKFPVEFVKNLLISTSNGNK